MLCISGVWLIDLDPLERIQLEYDRQFSNILASGYWAGYSYLAQTSPVDDRETISMEQDVSFPYPQISLPPSELLLNYITLTLETEDEVETEDDKIVQEPVPIIDLDWEE